MKKSILFFVCFCLTMQCVVAQSYQVDWGPVYKSPSRISGQLRIIDLDHEHYYLFTGTRNNSIIAKYNYQHQLISTTPAVLKYDDKPLVAKQFIHTRQHGFFTHISDNWGERTLRLYASKVNQGKVATTKLVYEHQFKDKWFFSIYGAISLASSSVYQQLNISQDSNRVAFYNPLAPKEGKSPDKLAIAVFDAEMNLQWDKVQDIKYPDKDVQIQRVIVSNQGEVFMLVRIHPKQKNSQLISKDFTYRILRFTENDFQDYEINVESQISLASADLYLPKANQEELIISGFYTDEELESGLRGVFFARVNVASGAIEPTFKEFEEDIISKELLDEGKGLYDSYIVDNIIELENGSFVWFAENSSHFGIYISYEILIPRFNSKGEFEKITVIEKDFGSGLGKDMNYAFTEYKDKLYFVYNDRKTREERLALQKGPKDQMGSAYVDLTVVDENGNIETQINLFNNSNIELGFRPTMYESKDNTLLFVTSSKRKYAIGLLQLD